MQTKWTLLCLAGIFEILWPIILKYYYLNNGNSKIYIFPFVPITAILAFLFLTIAMKNIPIGVAYAMWTGMGVVGVTILGIVLFNESAQPIKLIMIAIILIGIVGLKLIN